MSAAEYLSTSFPDLDREYVRGEVIERPRPVFQHGQVQGRMFASFDRLAKTHSLHASVEQRLRVADDVTRIADVAVFAGSVPDPVPATPPLVVVEVISADDRWSNLYEKLEEYENWGVPNLWLVDLGRRALLVYRNGNIAKVESFHLTGYPFEIRFHDLID